MYRYGNDERVTRLLDDVEVIEDRWSWVSPREIISADDPAHVIG